MQITDLQRAKANLLDGVVARPVPSVSTAPGEPQSAGDWALGGERAGAEGRDAAAPGHAARCWPSSQLSCPPCQLPGDTAALTQQMKPPGEGSEQRGQGTGAVLF